MALSAGTKLGSYEILGLLGAGGMGEVYRARDPRLNRDVAVKVLPASFSADPDRLQRFAQEARAAAALNHPNILSIHDIGEAQGAPFVVSELLEGETLRERLKNGALPTRKAIDYALQVARGLAVAHDKGIVHRDLKPENLFLTHDGRVKILDFGLAKLTGPEESGLAGNVPTATDPGLVMGTVGYMSPEQVRGKPADHRSDIFAFGAILYEMLSGKRAFHGSTPADTMSAILKEEPPELSEAARNVPPALERIVRHCLEKGPAQRFQSAGDVAFDLEALTDISAASKIGVQPVAAMKRRWLLPAVALLLVAASYLGVYRGGKRSGGSASAPSFHRLTFRRGTIWAARFAPDGQTIVYGAAWDGRPEELFTTRFDSTDSRAMGLEKMQVLSISSNGEMAVSTGPHATAPFTEEGTLARVPLAGGAPREVLENVSWADWTPDGQTLAIARRVSGTLHLEYPPGKVIYTPNGWVSHVRISPKGDWVAFEDHVFSGDDGRVVVVDREGNRRAFSRFYATVQGLAWSRDGSEVWFTAAPGGAARALYATNLSGKERLVLRVPGTLTLQDISREGRVLLAEDNAQVNMFGLAPGETRERNLSWFDWTLLRDLSKDGRTVVFDETGEAVGGKYGVFLRKTDGSAAAVRLGDGYGPVFSPDEKWVAAIDNGSPAQIELLPTGVGEPKQLTHDNLEHTYVGWLPDGNRIALTAAEPNHPRRTFVMDLKDGKSRAITPEGVSSTLVSPDGKYLLAGRDQKFFLYPIDGGEPRPFPALREDDRIVRWNPGMKGLWVYVRGVPARVFRVDPATGQREEWRQIVPSDPAGVQDLVPIRFSADGKSYAYSYYRVLSDLYVVEGLR